MMMLGIVFSVFAIAFTIWVVGGAGKKNDKYYNENDSEDDQLFI